MRKVITRSKIIVAASIVSLSAAFSAPASAGGFLGDIIEGACGGCGAGKTLDRVHRELGNPLDQAVDGVAAYYGGSAEPSLRHPIWYRHQ